MEQDKEVYKNNGFVITEHPRKREYDNPDINKYDHIYRISITGINQPTIEDAAMLVYFLLRNKIIENKFQEYREIIADAIFKAEADRNELMYDRGYEIN